MFNLFKNFGKKKVKVGDKKYYFDKGMNIEPLITYLAIKNTASEVIGAESFKGSIFEKCIKDYALFGKLDNVLLDSTTSDLFTMWKNSEHLASFSADIQLTCITLWKTHVEILVDGKTSVSVNNL